ncbi:MAG: hypothetical protein ACFE9R_07480 [Candidatus Hermodarchaeota archaeon]
MKKMLITQNEFEKKLYSGRYINGQLAVFVHDYRNEPIAELSVLQDSVELAPDEFILKEYSENEDLAQEFIKSGLIVPLNRFILIGSHLCPICKIET